MSPRVRALALHSRYRCANTGACCSSGWTIAVEPLAEQRIAAGLRTGALRAWDGSLPSPWSHPLDGRPHGARVALRMDASGACVFFDRAGRRLCAVHHSLGEHALPSACRQFPRVVTLTPLGASVTLSHYCPTAAGLLLAAPPGPRTEARTAAAPHAALADPLLSIVESPPAFPPDWPFEGLDARAALPPFLRPGVLMSWPALERWEEHAARVLAGGGPPEAAVARLASDAERARAWTPADGEFDHFFAAVLEEPRTPPELRLDAAESWRIVAGCVKEPSRLPPPPPPDAAGLAAGGGSALARPVRRWLAARSFASWVMLQGGGLRTTVAALATALGVLRAESGRGCREAGRTLDAELLLQAVRRADLLLVHLADPERLARRLSACETPRGRVSP